MVFTLIGWALLIAGMYTTKNHKRVSASLLAWATVVLTLRLIYILLGGN